MAYRLLYPIRTYLVVSGRIGEEVNVMAADWVTPVSARPFIVAAAVAPSRYTHSLVKRYREFVISVPRPEMLDDLWLVGTESGPSKLAKTSLRLKPATRVGAPVIEGALANIECEVIGEHEYGDHTLFVGKVVAYEYDKRVFEGFRPRPDAGFLAHLALDDFLLIKGGPLKPSSRG